MKKINNKGWSLNEFLLFLLAFSICLGVVIILYNKLFYDKKPQIIRTNSNIEKYIELEDKINESAKLYNNKETEDNIIIKFDSLIKNGFIKNIKDPKNNNECSGYVIYKGKTKEYKTYLSCPGNYQTSDYNKDLE